MRPLEILFFAATAACIALFLKFPTANKLLWYALAAVLLTMGLQLGLEGFRWQLTFAYIAVILPLVALVKPDKRISSPSFSPKAGGKLWCVYVILLLISACLAVLVPIPNLPAPDGPYPVGTQSFYLTDQNRLETLSDSGTAKRKPRELMIQVWYPSVKTAGAKASPYMPLFSDLTPFCMAPLFALAASHLPLIPTHSTKATPICPSADRYPVLIFSHGLMGGRFQNTVLAEELASQRYVVIGIDHTYDCSFAILPDRTICSLLLTQNPPPLAMLTDQGLGVRVQDVHFVIDQLFASNQADLRQLFTDRLDLKRIGVYGHSLGGQTALVACATDKRIKAGLSMDGATMAFNSIDKPFMLMQAARPGDPLEIEALCQRLVGPHYLMTLSDSGHANFTDLPLLTPLHWLARLSGSIDGARATKIIDDYALAFFDHALQGKNEPLLQNQHSFPEVEFHSWPKEEAK